VSNVIYEGCPESNIPFFRVKKSQSSPTTRHESAWVEVQLLLILDLGTRWEWSASRPGRALAPVKGPPVPIVQEAGWASEPVWTQRLQQKSFRLCRGSNLDRPVVQPVARHYTDWTIRLTMCCGKEQYVPYTKSLLSIVFLKTSLQPPALSDQYTGNTYLYPAKLN
jgi:hypothetical protein